jgi:hypothetical protein
MRGREREKEEKNLAAPGSTRLRPGGGSAETKVKAALGSATASG